MSRGRASNHRAWSTSWPGWSFVDCARAMNCAKYPWRARLPSVTVSWTIRVKAGSASSRPTSSRASRRSPRGRPNAVIGRESADEQLVHAELVQGGLQVPPLNGEGLERGVRIHLRVHALRQDHRTFRDFQIGMESGSLCPLDAVHRPCSSEFLEVLRLPGMPVPREDHRQPATSEQGDRAVHPWDNCIAFRHPERSAWTEVILDVDDEQRGPLPHGPDRPNATVAKSLRPPD